MNYLSLLYRLFIVFTPPSVLYYSHVYTTHYYKSTQSEGDENTMKRIAKITVIMFLVLLMSPLVVFAKVPKGYLEVKITAKNFKNYFEVVKMKHYDEFGDYDGYDYVLKSKLLKKGYYLCNVSKDFAYKYLFTEKSKYKYKKKTHKNTVKRMGTRGRISTFYTTECSFFAPLRGWRNDDGYTYDYKYGRCKNFKITKAKGKVLFVKPENVIKKEKDRIIIKNPYKQGRKWGNAGLYFFGKIDYVFHEEDYDGSYKEVIDYYYMSLDYVNKYNDQYDEGVLIR